MCFIDGLDEVQLGVVHEIFSLFLFRRSVSQFMPQQRCDSWVECNVGFISP